MRSWDCWDTLIARRSVVDVRNEMNNVFPIAENVAQVRPGDVLVSDYYDPDLLRTTIRDVTGLTNRLIVTAEGKRSGSIWRDLRELNVTEHIGDDPYSDVESPSSNGIKGTHCRLASFTPIEIALDKAGFKGLSRSIREARLIQQSTSFRAVQLLQTQINFPLLFLASLVLHRDSRADRILMSSRDCFLWRHVQEFVRDLHRDGYEVIYFKTSRLARAFPTRAYIEYVNANLPGVIADVGGTGWSLSRLIEHTAQPGTPIVLITRYEVPELWSQYEAMGSTASAGRNVRTLLRGRGTSVDLEVMNLAPHPMYLDPPETFNPLGLDWERVPEIEVMQASFFATLQSARHYDFAPDMNGADSALQTAMRNVLDRAADYGECLWPLRTVLYQENVHVMQRLDEIALQQRAQTRTG